MAIVVIDSFREDLHDIENILKEILPVIHSGAVHNGRKPATNNTTERNIPQKISQKITTETESHITTLQKILDDAVETEDFELAAVLRDQIGAIQNQSQAQSLLSSFQPREVGPTVGVRR